MTQDTGAVNPAGHGGAPGAASMRRLRDGLLVAAEYTAEALYGLVRPEWRRSGATEEEACRQLPGDDLVAAANYVVTRAESIGAAPEQVWPWLVQMGYRRGGFYGDFPWWRDQDRHREARSSAAAVHPEFQHLEEATCCSTARTATRTPAPGESASSSPLGPWS
jgi:hypothetical protein